MADWEAQKRVYEQTNNAGTIAYQAVCIAAAVELWLVHFRQYDVTDMSTEDLETLMFNVSQGKGPDDA